MKGNRDDRFHSLPKILLSGQRAAEKIGQAEAEALEAAVFEKEYQIFQDAAITCAGTMPGERRPPFLAVQTEMRFPLALKKASANRAKRISRRPQLFPALPANDVIARKIEKGAAQLAKSGETKDLRNFAPDFEAPQGPFQAPVSSLFC